MSTAIGLRRRLLEPQLGRVPVAMLDCAAHMLLYADDLEAVQRIALRHLLAHFSAGRTDLGFGSPSQSVYRACASERAAPSIADVLGIDWSNTDCGIQMVWRTGRSVTLAVKTDPRLQRSRPVMAVLGTVSKLARRIENQAGPFAIVCVDRLDGERSWTDADRRYLDDFVVKFLGPILTESRGIDLGGPSLLTRAEQKVARLAAAGLSYKEVAAMLGKSRNTVDNQLRQIRAKLSVHNQVELARACAALD